MAIYHLSAKMISRANGSSALAAAAYRSASRLHDQRLDRHHDFSNKAGVVHSEVMLPESVPQDFADRETLWNAVEAAEVRMNPFEAKFLGLDYNGPFDTYARAFFSVPFQLILFLCFILAKGAATEKTSQ